MAEVASKWYVLRAISGKEGKVKEYIEGAMHNDCFDGNVHQVLIPTERVLQKSGNGNVVKERNMLPGYVLVEALLVGEVAHQLRNIPNVLGFLGGMDNPSPVSTADINRILGKMDEMPEEDLELKVNFQVGDKVKVNDGPFSGFSGEIEDVNPEKKTLTVSVRVFGRPTPLSLGFMQVEKE
ncbi:MAG: transcription termination/antitermination factor NusG [Bacteroidales bacterium]|nr:transcription termination/antitermination factor NusG [Candidatus Equimonas faecalis]